jgi:hypothetical protein
MVPPPLSAKRICSVDKKHKKKLRRAAKKKKDKASSRQLQDKISKQINMFDRMPESCSACSVVFPKTKAAHLTWQVMTWTNPPKVRLFCPACQTKAKELLENSNEV